MTVFRLGHPRYPDASYFSGAAQITWPQLIFWSDMTTSTDGQATFFPTDDGTASGNALVTTLLSVSAVCEADVANVNTPLASVNNVNSGLTQIVVNTVQGQTIGGLGLLSLISAADDTVVRCSIIGAA